MDLEQAHESTKEDNIIIIFNLGASIFSGLCAHMVFTREHVYAPRIISFPLLETHMFDNFL